jgi:hypothetical protein
MCVIFKVSDFGQMTKNLLFFGELLGIIVAMRSGHTGTLPEVKWPKKYFRPGNFLENNWPSEPATRGPSLMPNGKKCFFVGKLPKIHQKLQFEFSNLEN